MGKCISINRILIEECDTFNIRNHDYNPQMANPGRISVLRKYKEMFHQWVGVELLPKTIHIASPNVVNVSEVDLAYITPHILGREPIFTTPCPTIRDDIEVDRGPIHIVYMADWLQSRFPDIAHTMELPEVAEILHRYAIGFPRSGHHVHNTVFQLAKVMFKYPGLDYQFVPNELEEGKETLVAGVWFFDVTYVEDKHDRLFFLGHEEAMAALQQFKDAFNG